jgi:hypothetical protein
MSHMVCGHIEIMLQFSAILQLVQMVLLAMLDPTGTLSFAGEIAMWWGNKLGAFCLHTHACVHGSHRATLVHSSPLVTRHSPPTCLEQHADTSTNIDNVHININNINCYIITDFFCIHDHPPSTSTTTHRPQPRQPQAC